MDFNQNVEWLDNRKLISLWQELPVQNIIRPISNYLHTHHEATKIGFTLHLKNKEVAQNC
jgi:hypothetical protein